MSYLSTSLRRETSIGLKNSVSGLVLIGCVGRLLTQCLLSWAGRIVGSINACDPEHGPISLLIKTDSNFKILKYVEIVSYVK